MGRPQSNKQPPNNKLFIIHLLLLLCYCSIFYYYLPSRSEIKEPKTRKSQKGIRTISFAPSPGQWITVHSVSLFLFLSLSLPLSLPLSLSLSLSYFLSVCLSVWQTS